MATASDAVAAIGRAAVSVVAVERPAAAADEARQTLLARCASVSVLTGISEAECQVGRAVGIDPGQRAEQLSLAEFAALARSLPCDSS